MDKQRIYDAMLIKAFRADVTVGMLWYWLKVYKIDIPNPELKRQPPSVKMRVQSFVGHYLKPLADRLWDTDKVHDIKTLDWMANLESQRTGGYERENLKRRSNLDRRRSGVLRASYEGTKQNNQWNVTKGKTRVRRVK